MLRKILCSEPGFEIVGEAVHGKQAIKLADRLRPDAILMDVVMPVMDGITATAEIMAKSPCPVILISDVAQRDSALNFRALQCGALDLLPKPTLGAIDSDTSEIKLHRFRKRVHLLAEVPVVTRVHRAARQASQIPLQLHSATREATAPAYAPGADGQVELVVVGASTGGPPAIAQLLAAWKVVRSAWPVLIVQHMAAGFIEGMARWLDQTTGCRVKIAEHGEEPCRGYAYLAPDDQHMVFDGHRLWLVNEPPRKGNRPSIDRLFFSVAESCLGSQTCAVLLTGMGDDGAQGLQAIRVAGGITIAQDEETSVVYGMPKAACEIGAAAEVLALDEIAQRVVQLTNGEQPKMVNS